MSERPPRRRAGAAIGLVALVVALALIAWWALDSAPDDASAPPPDGAAADAPRVHPRARPRSEKAATADEPAEEPASEETPAPAADPSVRRLRIVDSDRAPIEGVRVLLVEERRRRTFTSDAEGAVEIPVDEDGDPVVSVFDGEATREVRVGADVHEVVVADLPVLEVVVIDASTGREVAVPRIEVTTWMGTNRAVTSIEGASPRVVRLPLDARRSVDVFVDVEPPPGFGAVGGIGRDGPVAPQAKRARIIVPVFPAVTRRLRAVDEARRPVAGAGVLAGRLVRAAGAEMRDNAAVSWRAARSGADGFLVVEGLPAVPCNALRLQIAPGPGAAESLRGEFRSASSAGDDGAVDVVVAPESKSFWGPGSWERSHGRGDDRFVCGTGVEYSPLTVRVVRRDGTPASGVYVGGRGDDDRTGADGRIRLAGVERGRAQIVAQAPGFVPGVVTADVGQVEEVVVREGESRTVRVTVVGADGRPVRAVCVAAWCMSIRDADGREAGVGSQVAQLDGDVEILTPRTGADGVVVLTVPVGRISYVATLAGAATEVEADEGDVRIVLKSLE